ncbi:MAG: hypothetical protein RLZZ480_357 [Candidatus Parcubacteria bacterium]
MTESFVEDVLMPVTTIFFYLSIFCGVLSLTGILLYFWRPTEQRSIAVGQLFAFTFACWLASRNVTGYIVIPALIFLLIFLPLVTDWLGRSLRR